MKCRGATANNVKTNICRFLLVYRTTEHAMTGQTPSDLLMGRRIRNKLDLILPNFQSTQNKNQWKQLEKQSNMKDYTPSSCVMVRSYNTASKWVPGKILEKLGNMHYNIEMH